MAHTLKCVYCGKVVSGETEYQTLQRLRIHLRHCKVRKTGFQFPVGMNEFTVQPRSYKTLQKLHTIQKEITNLSPLEQSAFFLGYLVSEKGHRTIKDFKFKQK